MLQSVNSVNLNNIQASRPKVNFKAKNNPATDTFETNTPKKTSSNLGIGLAIAAVGALAVGFAAHKNNGFKNLWNKITGKTKTIKSSATQETYLANIEDIQSRFSKIFGREISKQEANEMALRYKEIFQTENNSKFMGNLFEQLKKDYKLPEMRYYLSPLDNGTYACYSPLSGVTYNMNRMTLTMNGNVANITSIDRENIVNAIAHELKHAKQDEIMFRTDFQETVKAFAEREAQNNSLFFRHSLTRCNNDRGAAIRDCETRFKEKLIEGFKNPEPLPEKSQLRQKGLKYIENMRNYTTPEVSYNGYRNQIIESEAFDAGENFLTIYKQLIG